MQNKTIFGPFCLTKSDFGPKSEKIGPFRYFASVWFLTSALMVPQARLWCLRLFSCLVYSFQILKARWPLMEYNWLGDMFRVFSPSVDPVYLLLPKLAKWISQFYLIYFNFSSSGWLFISVSVLPTGPVPFDIWNWNICTAPIYYTIKPLICFR